VSEAALYDIGSRQEMIRFFDGYGSQRVEELGRGKLQRPLVKTQLLETVRHLDGDWRSGLSSVLHKQKLVVKSLDETLFYVADSQHRGEAFVEPLNDRVLAFYGTAKAKEFDAWVKPLVQQSSDLDFVWLSGLAFNELWKYVVDSTEPYRYVRLGFSHQRLFDINDEDEAREFEDGVTEDEMEEGVERRATTSRLTDRLRELQDRLGSLQQLYSPFFAISQLRLPSTTGRGGHDFYDNGRVTNRGGDFLEHRSQISFVADVYERLLALTEGKAWYAIEPPDDGGLVRPLNGVPVRVRFRESLSAAAFDRWMETTFANRRNRFRLWGVPTRLGPTKVHVHGVDQHLWQPVHLELTSAGCTILLPQNSCANIVHRFVTNIQRYIDPGASAFVGSTPYEELVARAIREALRRDVRR
jgi:hypothetical protein